MLGLLIGETPVATGYCVADLVFLYLGFGIHLQNHRVGEFILIGAQRADVIAQFLRQHGNSAVHQIDRRGAFVCLLVDDGARCHIMTHVSDVDTNLPIAVLEFLDGEGVIKVFGIGRVDGKRRHISHVAAFGNFLGRNTGIQSLGGFGDVLRVFVRQTKLSQDSMNLGIVLACHTQHVNHLADGRIGILGPIYNLDNHLVASLATGQSVQRNKDVCGQELAVSGKLGKVFHHLQRTDEHLLLALENLYNLGLRLHAMACSADVHQHAVTVQGMHRVALGNHDGQTVITSGIHTVLAVTAADEDAFSYRRAVHGLVAARPCLSQEAVHGQLFQDVHDERATFGGVSANSGRHLLVVERSLALLIKEVNHTVMIFTTLLFQ